MPKNEKPNASIMDRANELSLLEKENESIDGREAELKDELREVDNKRAQLHKKERALLRELENRVSETTDPDVLMKVIKSVDFPYEAKEYALRNPNFSEKHLKTLVKNRVYGFDRLLPWVAAHPNTPSKSLDEMGELLRRNTYGWHLPYYLANNTNSSAELLYKVSINVAESVLNRGGFNGDSGETIAALLNNSSTPLKALRKIESLEPGGYNGMDWYMKKIKAHRNYSPKR
ncbi:hypothetical protein HOG17_00120 [Candidatus Peregrinibacteria bacterium]|jgi:hypothetical protein|nr:hypothetical protein [Candidatus Peregrinibacteria bacterium]MBT4147666.1 hypothetical protein [Candidatus Peregrinibacteria bacterium]MBT4366278.1 hypothetical protein [Candidatus Peregrinibacteria bacterium]MBT4455794.1 hypothetical protein [Candidatus Peregrinibacteria bacterium]